MAEDAPMAQDAPMAVDAPAAHSGMQLYSALVLKVLRGLELLVAETQLLQPGKQLLIYHHAAQLYDCKDAILALWREEKAESEVADVYREAALAVKEQCQNEGTWPAMSELKGKKVFGHAAAIKFLKFPILSETGAACVFLQLRPRVASEASTEMPWTFAEGQFTDPITDLEAKRSAAILHMDHFCKGAVVVANPLLRTGSGFDSASESLAQTVAKEAEVWRRLLKTEHDLFSQTTALFVRQVLKLGPVAAVATVTPKKPRKGADDRAPPDANMETPEKPPHPAKETPAQQDEHRAYGKLLDAMLQELGYFTEPFQSLRWLDNKKQLLVYYHAAQLTEKQEAVLAAMRGTCEQEVEDLLPPYKRALERVRDELNELPGLDGPNLRKMFSHDHVIRFHAFKGVPVPRTCCVFLRERPQCSSDVLRKTPSIFRDLIRYRNQGSPLMELEHHQLALVLTVQDRNPRAFVVISPLFDKPSLIEQVCEKTLGEIQEALKDQLEALIRRESDAWRAFIQSHADVVSKDSLKIIQRVLKTCQPGSGLGEYTLRFAEDVEEANQARELSEMKYAEAEQRWDMEAQLALADAEARWHSAEEKAGQQATIAEKAKLRAKSKVAKVKEQASETLEQERMAAQERQEAQQAAHGKEIADLTKELEESRATRARFEDMVSLREEEVQCLQDAKLELLHALSRMDTLCHAEARTLRTKNAVLKQHLKQKQREQKEQCGKAVQEAREACAENLKAAEAKFLEVQTATLAEQQKLIMEADSQVAAARREAGAAVAARKVAESDAAAATAKAEAATAKVEEAMASARRATATLEVQTAALQRTTALNAALRVEVSESKAELATAQQETRARFDLQRQVAAELETRTKELSSSRTTVTSLQAQLEDIQKKKVVLEQEVGVAKAKMQALTSDVQKARAETQAARDEASALATTCTQMRIEAAKVTQLQEERDKLEQRLAEASRAAGTRVEAERSLRNEMLAQVQDSNKALRIQLAEAKESKDKLSRQLSEMQEKLAEKATHQTAEASDDALQKAILRCEDAEAKAARADAACRQAQQSAADMAKRAETAEEGQRLLEKKDIETKAALTAQAQQAAHLTQKCASLNAALAEASDRATLAASAVAKADQDVAAKEAETVVLQQSLLAVQASNKALRSEAMQARQDAETAQSACEASKQGKLQAEAQAERAMEVATRAEGKALEHAASLQKLQAEHQVVIDKLAEMQQIASGAEGEIALAKAGERKAKSRFVAQASEAARLSELCTSLRAEVTATGGKVSAMEQRALQAEAERKVALASSDLREDDVKRIAADPIKQAFPSDHRLIAELEALLEEQSPSKPVTAEENCDSHKASDTKLASSDQKHQASPEKKRRLSSSGGHGTGTNEGMVERGFQPAADSSRVYAAPVYRVRSKSVGKSVAR